MANWPTYNPNNRSTASREQMRNRAVTDLFEPGSTLKPFTVAAALEAGMVKPDTIIQTRARHLTIGNATIHDAHREGALTVEQVIQKSSNVGAAKIALSLPAGDDVADASRGRLRHAAAAPAFPGEVVGQAAPGEDMEADRAGDDGVRPRHLGQSLLQLARAYTIFANDGELKPLSLLKRDGTVRGPARASSLQTAQAVRTMLEMAVQPGGTAPKAQIAGYRVGRQDRHGAQARGHVYAQQVHRRPSSGFAPVSNPRLDRRGDDRRARRAQYYGGAVAAPVFSSVMGAALRLLRCRRTRRSTTSCCRADDADVEEET